MGFEVFGVGVPELVIILVVALIFLGPEKLPDAARTVGSWVREIRTLSNDALGVWRETLDMGEELKQSVQPANLLAPQPVPPPSPAEPSPTALPLVVPYTPPAAVEANGAGPADLSYPAPFEAPAPTPPRPLLDYPAPFAGED